MIKAYNNIWVDNIENQEIIQDWHKKNVLNSEQLEAAKTNYPVGFYKANAFVKIGLFLFTNMVSAASIGFLSIFLVPILDESSFGLGVLSLFYGGFFFYILEYFIKKNNFYRSGVDNALLYGALACLITAFAAFSDFDLPLWTYYLFSFVICTAAFIRYADPFVTIVWYILLLLFSFDVITTFPLGKVILPFVFMLISALVYFGFKWWKGHEENAYYTASQDIIESLAAATFYLAGNYYVVREGNTLLNSLPESIQIDFAPLFYLITALIPLLYIFMGLKKHDRKLLIVGILATAFSVFTYRAYNSNMPLEWALLIAGIHLIMLSVSTINALKIPKLKLTSKDTGKHKYQDFEAFIINQAINRTNDPSDQTQFGGGDFGGGGAGANY
jgi:hypothetical protein